ncbi:MAG: FkbM family methyltransferase [Bacteroidota bacterium]|nr:FkbM family methyltransferase [Bacteroidota bacterium]
MNNSVKSIVKKVFPVTLNQRYDKQTKRIMQIVLEDESTFIDVGSHKGEVLELALKISKKGKHFAFEPIPNLFHKLNDKYGSKCEVLNYGLSDQKKQSSFQHVTTNPAYSGIKMRTYPKDEQVETIQIQLDTLDNQLKQHDRVDMIKIDVEGAELEVLKGAKKIIEKFHPIIVFEHGLGASDHYNTSPEDILTFFDDHQYQLFTLKGFIADEPALLRNEFIDFYLTNKEYYFLAKLRVS